jgi:hypothetical protein
VQSFSSLSARLVIAAVAGAVIAAPGIAAAGNPTTGRQQLQPSPTPDQEATKKEDESRLEGMWQMVYSGAQPAGMTYYLFTKDTLSIICVVQDTKPGHDTKPAVTRMSSFHFRLDTTSDPKGMRLTSVEKAGKEMVDHVYEFRDRTLWIAPRRSRAQADQRTEENAPNLPRRTAAELLHPETSEWLVGLEKLELKPKANAPRAVHSIEIPALPPPPAR